MNATDEAQRKIEEAYQLRRQGDRDGALQAYEAAVALLRGMDESLRLAHTIRHVADLQRELGDHHRAAANYTEALAIYRANPATEPLDLANSLRGYGLLMEATGDGAGAGAMWAEAGEVYAIVGVQAGVDEAARRTLALAEGRNDPR